MYLHSVAVTSHVNLAFENKVQMELNLNFLSLLFIQLRLDGKQLNLPYADTLGTRKISAYGRVKCSVCMYVAENMANCSLTRGVLLSFY